MICTHKKRGGLILPLIFLIHPLYKKQNSTIMKYETRIVLLDVNSDSGRKDLDRIENQKFNSIAEVEEIICDAEISTLSDFMDLCNNQELNLDEYWVGYVQIKV